MPSDQVRHVFGDVGREAIEPVDHATLVQTLGPKGERPRLRRRREVLAEARHAERLHDIALMAGSARALADLAQEVLLEGDLREMHPIVPWLDQLTLRSGICGSATKATPLVPKSARQTASRSARGAVPCRR